MFQELVDRGYQIEFHSHAKAILSVDFPEVEKELTAALTDFAIPIEELVAGGGGEAQGTQRLRRNLADLGWSKMNFLVERRINNIPKESQSHEVDHVRELSSGQRIALEIEWNNKDPFFDRDLENYKRLHSDGAISVGIIITKGRSLHNGMKELIKRFLGERGIADIDGLAEFGYSPTQRQRGNILRPMQRANNPLSFQDAFVGQFVSDKFGEATTHWRKLEDRVQRGVGNPCPLLLIGLPKSVVSFAGTGLSDSQS